MTEHTETETVRSTFYYDPQGEPFFNMAFDNWLFDKIQDDNKFPRVILRLYRWSEPAITLGYNQNIEKVINFDKLDISVPVIRRISGGRAIYHDETEITFSLTADLNIFPEEDRSLSKTNQLISEVIVNTLDSVGVLSQWAKKSDASFTSASTSQVKSCFNSYSRYEIFSQAGKIVAGAQRRKGDYFIHQGSIKINGISACPAIGQQNEASRLRPDRDNNDSYIYTIEQFRNLFPETFTKSLNVQITESELTPGFRSEICLLGGKIKAGEFD